MRNPRAMWQLPPVMFGHLDRPNRAYLRTEDQYVLILLTTGLVAQQHADLVGAIIDALINLPLRYEGDGNQREYACLRGVSIDTTQRVVTVSLDLIHDESVAASMDEATLTTTLSALPDWAALGLTLRWRVKIRADALATPDFTPFAPHHYYRVWLPQ